MKVEFFEEQRFTQWWLWIILCAITMIPVYGIFKQIILGEPFGNKPMSDSGLVIFAIVMFGALWFFSLIKMTTLINEESIRMEFFPFASKFTLWKDVESAEVVNYGFIGGWGVRIGTRYGTVYNVKGNKGLAITLKNGKKYLIGTQKPIALEVFLDRLGR